MNIRASNIPAAYRLAVVARALAAVAIVFGILFVGYVAPAASEWRAAPEDTPAPVYDNGPTGYFPDMFFVDHDADDSADPIATF